MPSQEHYPGISNEIPPNPVPTHEWIEDPQTGEFVSVPIAQAPAFTPSPIMQTQPVFIPVPTADGITLKKQPFATKKKTLPDGALIYRNRFDLGNGSAVYTLGLTQTEALEMAASAKPLQQQTGALDHEAKALAFEQNRLLSQLEKAKAGTLELCDTDQQAIETRLLAIDARLVEIAFEREKQQIQSLPMLDGLLSEKIVALEWDEDGQTCRSTEMELVLDDLELKGQISDLLMGGGRNTAGNGGNFLAPR